MADHFTTFGVFPPGIEFVSSDIDDGIADGYGLVRGFTLAEVMDILWNTKEVRFHLDISQRWDWDPVTNPNNVWRSTAGDFTFDTEGSRQADGGNVDDGDDPNDPDPDIYTAARDPKARVCELDLPYNAVSPWDFAQEIYNIGNGGTTPPSPPTLRIWSFVFTVWRVWRDPSSGEYALDVIFDLSSATTLDQFGNYYFSAYGWFWIRNYYSNASPASPPAYSTPISGTIFGKTVNFYSYCLPGSNGDGGSMTDSGTLGVEILDTHTYP